MSGIDDLLPPAELIHARLTENQRDRRLLRTLLKLTFERQTRKSHPKHEDPRRPATGPEVGR